MRLSEVDFDSAKRCDAANRSALCLFALPFFVSLSQLPGGVCSLRRPLNLMPCPLKAAFDQAHPTFYLPVAVIGAILAVCAPYLYRGATK